MIEISYFSNNMMETTIENYGKQTAQNAFY